MALNLHIVTPARNMLTTTCEDVVLPGFDGEMGILTEHTRLVNRLGAGIVTIKGGTGDQQVAIRGGVVEIANNEVTVLADDAVFPKEVNAQKLETEQEQVSQELLTVSDSDIERDRVFEKQAWITAQKNLINRP